MAHDPIPLRIGREWLFADGTRLPVISGGADGDGGEGGAAGGDGGGSDGGGGDGSGGDAGGQSAPTVESLQAEAEKWKAMSRKHEATAKSNADAAARLKELENAGKSETEKLQAALDESRSAARLATVKALKLQVAAEKGLPATLAKFLPDVDNEIDMMTAADELLEAAGSPGKGDPPTRQPKSNLTNPMSDGNDPAAERERLIASMLGKATA